MRRKAKRPRRHLRVLSRTFRACCLCYFLFGVYLLAPTAAVGQEADSETTSVESGMTTVSYVTQNKDVWDKLSAISGIVSGVAVALIGGAATYLYNERQRRAEDNRNSREIAVQRVQTVQTFLPHLASRDEQEKKAALLAIGRLGDAKLASDLAALFGGEGAVSALAAIARSPNQQDANIARRSLGELFDLLRLSVVRVDPGRGARVGASGFVARSEGLVVTVSLIMTDAEPDPEFSVQFPNEASPREAQIVQNIPELRLALLKVEGGGFHALPIEEELPAVGEEIFALSYPREEEVWAPVVGRVVGTTLDDSVEPNLPETLLIQAKLQGYARAGFAGMPTVDSRGHVVAIGYASTSDPTEAVTSPVDRTPQLMSLLIPAANASQAIASIPSDSDIRE
jgi:S1-C subfamily serine protease